MERHLWLLVGLFGLLFTVQLVRDDQLLLGVAGGAAFLGVACWLSPWWRGRSLRHAEVQPPTGGSRHVVVYWRPGCRYCARLRWVLRGLPEQVQWVNIWQDPEAAAFVRGVNGGAETVPTVVVDGAPETNPDPVALRDRLRAC
ncbi:glutaredoxin domain-containing protein [Ornithinicoccus halotolerans]|uniref:glutaredoxin domain-containing protein n=1 Tax=Ornithinicoccus halotolerans TaxID=1748220 RepID=UPI0012976136|nr:glutaredoxin domain-containing protein [Ornithinicoccus halotolerans]